jgi:hypothetical protein
MSFHHGGDRGLVPQEYSSFLVAMKASSLKKYLLPYNSDE